MEECFFSPFFLLQVFLKMFSCLYDFEISNMTTSETSIFLELLHENLCSHRNST